MATLTRILKTFIMTQYLIEKYGCNLSSTSVEVKIDGTSGVYYLPDDSILRNCQILGLIIPDNEDDSAYSPEAMRPLVSNEVIRSSYITLKSVNDEVIHKHPLVDFLTALQAGDVRLLDLKGFNPQKSFIELPASALRVVGESYLLQFLYK